MFIEQNMDHAGIACAMKNAGVGVGLPDKGRARLVIEDGVCVIYCAASDIGQGCLTGILPGCSSRLPGCRSPRSAIGGEIRECAGLRYDIRVPARPCFPAKRSAVPLHTVERGHG